MRGRPGAVVSASRRPGDVGLAMRIVLRVFGECCLTTGVIVLLFLAYLLWGTAAATSAHQHAFATQLQREWRTHFAVAAHRVTAGNPFYDLNELRPGDAVMITTAAATYTYQVTHTELVLPGDTAVLDPVPGRPRQRPHEAMITLITCDPPWTGTHRIIVFGSLDAQAPRTGHNS